MTKCSQCGAENKDGARFCESCGAPLQQANQGNPTFCPQCGAQLAPGASFCPSCGYRVGGPVQNGPAPMYNQGYPQQPYGYPQPAPVIKTQEKVSLVRSLIVSIGLFATIALVIVSLLVEVAKGSSMNIIEILKPLFESFKDAKGCSLINFVAETLICVLPVVGVAIFAPIAIATGIKAIIKKSLPKYGPCGAVLGFAAPYFYFWTCLALETPDNKGFLFPKVAEYPALLLFLGAVGVYVVVGLVNAYMSAIENKRNLAAPIVKTFAAILGVAAIVFIFTPLIAITYKDSSDAISYSSESPMAMWTAISVLIAFMGDSIKFEPLLPIFAVIFLSLPMILGFVAVGDLFGKNTTSTKTSPFILLVVATIFSVITVFVTFKPSNDSIQMALPSMVGFAALGINLASMIFGIISAKQDARL